MVLATLPMRFHRVSLCLRLHLKSCLENTTSVLQHASFRKTGKGETSVEYLGRWTIYVWGPGSNHITRRASTEEEYPVDKQVALRIAPKQMKVESDTEDHRNLQA